MPSSKPKRRHATEKAVWTRNFVREMVSRDAPRKTTPKRLNFTWYTSRIEKIWQAARVMDVSLEAFIRFAAYERAIEVLAKEAPEPIYHERANHRRSYCYRTYPEQELYDLIPFHWRWRQHALQKVMEAAKCTRCHYREFIDVAAYDKAIQIAGPERV